MDTATKTTRSLGQVLVRRRIVALCAFAFGLVLAIAGAIIVKPSYGATAHVLLENDQQGRDPAQEGLDMPDIATSGAVLDPVIAQFNLPVNLRDFRKSITVKVAPKSSIMTISAKDRVPSTAVRISNAIAESFIARYASLAGGRYQGVIDRLNAQLAGHKTRMMSLESRLQRAAATSSYAGSQTSLDNLENSLNNLVTQRAESYAQYVSDKAQLATLGTESPRLSKIVRHEMLANDQTYRQLEINVSKDSANYAIRHAQYKDAYPGMADMGDAVRGEVAALRDASASALNGAAAYSPSLAEQIVEEQKTKASVQGDEARVAALDRQIAETRGGLQTNDAPSDNVSALRQLRDSEEAQYQALALRLSNAQANLAEANSLGSAVLIDRSEVAEPNLLGPNLLLVLGFLVAIGLAVAAAYIAEQIDPRLINVVDVETLYGRPVVGSLGKQ